MSSRLHRANSEIFIPTSEAAKLLGLSKEEVRTLCRQGMLAGAFRDSSKSVWQIPLTSVKTLAEQRSQTPLEISEAQSENKDSEPKLLPRAKTPVLTGSEAKVSTKVREHWPLITALIAIFLAVVSTTADWPAAMEFLTDVGIIPEFQSARPGENLIIIASFYYPENVQNMEAHTFIQSGIIDAASEAGLGDKVRVEVSKRRLRKDDKDLARQLGNRYGAAMVIWGQDIPLEVRVSFLNLMNRCLCAADIQLTEQERVLLRNPDSYSEFVLHDLPNQLTFLSLFALSEYYQFGTEDVNTALTVLKRAIESVPNNDEPPGVAEAYFRQGWLYQLRGEHIVAVDSYDRAISKGKDDMDVHFNLGVAYGLTGNDPAALREMEKAIEKDPTNPFPYIMISYSNAVDGNDQIAREYYEKALSLNPPKGLLDYFGPLILGELGAPEDQLPVLTDAIAKDPLNYELYQARAFILYDLEQWQASIDDINKIEDLGFIFPEVILIRGYAYMELHEYPDAIADFDRYIEAPTGQASLGEAYWNRGVARDMSGNTRESLADFKRAIDYEPENAGYYNSLGIVLDKLTDPPGALAAYSTAIRLDPLFVDPRRNRANVRYEVEDYTGAVEDYTEVLKLQPENADTYYWRGKCYEQLGMIQEALQDFSKYKHMTTGQSTAPITRTSEMGAP